MGTIALKHERPRTQDESMNASSISVIIPTYNRAALIGRAISSALANIQAGDEVIVVDDGSTDETGSVVAQFGSAIRYVRTENRGAGAARNRGVREARCPLIALLDSDDEWWPDKLEMQRTVMRLRPDVAYCFTDFGVREDGEEHRNYLVNWHLDRRPWSEILGPPVPYSALGTLPAGRSDFNVYIGDLYATLLNGNYVSTFTFVARRSAGEALQFSEDLPIMEDWICFARVARLGNVAYLETETAWNYGHKGPRVTDTDEFARAGSRLAVMDRVWGADPVFMARHGAAFKRAMVEQRKIRAAYRFRRGEGRLGLAELAAAGPVPFSTRVISKLPGPALRWAVQLRSRLRHRVSEPVPSVTA